MSYLTRYLGHLGTYTPMFGALAAVPPSEALLVGFVTQRLVDISRVSSMWAHFMEDYAPASDNDDAFADIDEMVTRFPPLPQTIENPLCQQALANPKPQERWRFQRDAFFGAQRVLGMNPLVLQRVNPVGSVLAGIEGASFTQLSSFGDAEFQAALAALGVPSPGPLAQQIALGHVYACDYSSLAAVATEAGEFLPTCVGVFYAAAGALLPVGIQVVAGAGQPIAKPGDGASWRVAKKALAAADVFHHELNTHLGRVHYGVLKHTRVARSMLGKQHPVRVMLEPHFHAVVLNMEVGKRLLTNQGGMVEDVLPPTYPGLHQYANAVFDNFNFASMNPRVDVAARGCDDATQLPFYPYRDCAVPLWDAIFAYTKACMLKVYGNGPLDAEVVAWRQEIFAQFTPAQLAGFQLNTRDDLARLVAYIIYLAAPFHSAVNYGQTDHAIAVAAMPGSLYADPATAAAVMPMMPGHARYIRQVEVLALLSARRFTLLADVDYLANCQAEWQQFGQALAGIENQIANKSWAGRFKHLLPSRIAAAANV